MVNDRVIIRAGTIQPLANLICIMIPQTRYDTYRDTFSEYRRVQKELKLEFINKTKISHIIDLEYKQHSTICYLTGSLKESNTTNLQPAGFTSFTQARFSAIVLMYFYTFIFSCKHRLIFLIGFYWEKKEVSILKWVYRSMDRQKKSYDAQVHQCIVPALPLKPQEYQ